MDEDEQKKGKKFHINTYVLVFGVIAVLIAIAALSTFLFNKNLSSETLSAAALPNYGPAPNIQGISAWINSQPLNISQLKGKVILVDFWTYSCINCIRTIPQLNAWYNAYGNNGLVIIGVHTPEFQFEHNYSNVYSAVKMFGIKYPVALDNNYSTWDAYNNQYWPADYLIDKNGNIRYESFGEGNYNQTEAVIRELLENSSYVVQSNFTNVKSNVNLSQIGSPELYLGYAKARVALGNSQGFDPGTVVNYTFQNISYNNVVYLSGKWYNAPQDIVAVNDSKIFLVYYAKNVNIVASGNGNATSAAIMLDGKNLTTQYLGSDDMLVNGSARVSINYSRLYNIVSSPSYGPHLLEIEANKGLAVYTFTFG